MRWGKRDRGRWTSEKWDEETGTERLAGGCHFSTNTALSLSLLQCYSLTIFFIRSLFCFISPTPDLFLLYILNICVCHFSSLFSFVCMIWGKRTRFLEAVNTTTSNIQMVTAGGQSKHTDTQCYLCALPPCHMAVWSTLFWVSGGGARERTCCRLHCSTGGF